ncbi:MAG: hypothetical protein ACP5E3_00015, partial [Bacteroidales bacterium]
MTSITKITKLFFLFLFIFGGMTKGITKEFFCETEQLEQDSPREFKARWIWTRVKYQEPFQHVRFRKQVELDQPVENATVFITADTFYR